MRLLHVTHQYPPAIGGSEQYIADLSEELAARGHQVDVFTSRSLDFHTWRNELPGYERRNGVNVYRFRSLQRRGYVWAMLHFGLRHYWPAQARRYEPFIFLGGGPICPGMYWSIRRRARKYDLVHLNCLVYSHVAYGHWAARSQGVPTLITPHLHFDQPVTFAIGYMRRALQECDHSIADTEAERIHLINMGLDSWRVSTVGVGVRPEQFPTLDRRTVRRQFGLPEDAYVMLFYGRKDEYKGIGRVIKAYSALRDEYPQLRLFSIGPETDYSRSLLARYKDLPGWVNLGALPDQARAQALNAADCLVLPSQGEAFGIVFLEAWLTHLPVIGPRNPSVSTLISEGQDGLLTDPTDVDELATCVRHLIDHPALARQMGERGRQKVLARYTVARIVDRVEGVYLRALRRRRRENGRPAPPLPSANKPLARSGPR